MIGDINECKSEGNLIRLLEYLKIRNDGSRLTTKLIRTIEYRLRNKKVFSNDAPQKQTSK